MENNSLNFFSENDFDIHEPHENHEARFLQKIKPKKNNTISLWKWMSVAASIILFIGFSLGSYHQKKQFDLANVSPKMKEAQDFFVMTIRQELNEIEKYRNLDNENIIEDALDKIEELEKNYDVFKLELKTQENERLIIQRMITNYQQRLLVLENLLLQLESLNTITKTTKHDEFI